MYLAAMLLCSNEACQFNIVPRPLTEDQCEKMVEEGYKLYADKGFTIVDGKCFKWDPKA